MKQLLLLSLLICSLYSCQSEYERQMELGKQLIQQENKIIDNLLQTHFNVSARETLVEIKSDLAHCAELSGNKELFYSEITSYRNSIKSDEYNNRLITKYP